MNRASKAIVMWCGIGVWVLYSGLAAWSQPAAPASPGAAAGDKPDPIRVHALLVGIGNEEGHGLSRSTVTRSLDRVGRALDSLKVPDRVEIFLERLVGEEASEVNIEKAWESIRSRSGENDFVVLYYLGAAFSPEKDAESGSWKLAVAETLQPPGEKPDAGLRFVRWSELLQKMSSRRVVCYFDVLVWKSEGADAREAAKKLAEATAGEKVAVTVIAAVSTAQLESATATESFSAQGLSYALEAREADAFPNGDTDGFITASEVTSRLVSLLQSQWNPEDPAFLRSEITRGPSTGAWKLGIIPERRAQLHEWAVQLGEKWGDRSVDSRLLLEAIRLLEGDESIESIPKDLRGAFITLIGRFNQDEFSREEYPLQRSIVLGIPFSDTQEPKNRGGGGSWRSLPIAVRTALIIIPVALLVYLLARLFLHRHNATVLQETAESAAPRAGAAGKGAASGAMTDAKSARNQPAIRPVGTPAGSSSGGSRGGGASASPASQRVAPTPASGVRRAGGGEPPSPSKVPAIAPSVPSGSSRSEEDTIAPPSLAELRARAAAEKPPAADMDAELDIMFEGRDASPAAAAASPSVPTPLPVPAPPKEKESALASVDLDLDVELELDEQKPASAGSKNITPPRPLPAMSPPPAGSGPVTPSSAKASLGTGPATPLPVRPGAGTGPLTPIPAKTSLGGKPAVGDTALPPSARMMAKPGSPLTAKSEPRVPAISPGVLPAVIRAWDLEWMGPMARSRFRLLCGGHLELGRPAGLQAPADSSLFISLLPVGENGKPNASLLAMLSRQALSIDLRGDGAKLTVFNKASVHMSPDPLRPYWDWDNPMPGAERIIGLDETLWVSPHFGKILAPISLRTLTTAGSVACSCAVQMNFDAVFFDLVAICVVLADEGFELVWGPPPQGQIVPNIGEGPEPLLHTQVTPRGLVIKPLHNGVWTRRQGAMVDEDSLLLGGVSAVEWKTEHGDYSLKLTPHALPGPRVGRPTDSPSQPPR